VEATTDVSCLLQRHYTCSDSHDSVKHGGKARTACHFLPTRQYCIKLKTDGVNVVLAKATRQRRDLLYKSWTIEKKIAMCTTNTVKLEVQLFVTAGLGRGGGVGTGDEDQRRVVRTCRDQPEWFVTSDKIW